MPPLDDALAALLLPQSAEWPADRKPSLPLQHDRETHFDKMFQLVAQLAAAANNLGVLGVLLASPQSHGPLDFNQSEFF